ncbi:unnamed protein product [Lactuca saligna]|uniref:non-specific serine/threonine protein kinase n=2 Tax=Lactuca saligna TaxID=75948 RepID=A0AA36EPD9_LACSI|nr:unnamed protein product [Lactuca saligna]
MVIELLGSNLQELLDRCGGKFSLKKVLMLANQLIEAVECMHDKGVIHRDIKPENLLMGLGSNVCQVAVQLCVPYRFWPCKQQGRRNDMESLAYVLVYFLKGSLPWQGLSAGSNEEEINEDVMRKKFAIKPEELCESCPPEFAVWITSCQCTHFEDMPYYTSIKARCRRLFKSKGYVFDYEYDSAETPKNDIKLGTSVEKPGIILATQDIHDLVEPFSRIRIISEDVLDLKES